MEHLAILAKKRKILSKIISGEKTIESRWYVQKRTPYKKIQKGEVIYFKEAGDPVRVKARVKEVLFFEDLNEERVKRILEEYGRRICIRVSYAPKLSGKKYCTLIFLEEVKTLENPFEVDKKGFGLMAAWITTGSVERLKR